MSIEELLKIKSLHEGKLIAGKKGISNEIKSINVLEAIDIENWGRTGDVILTSFFALQNLSDAELDTFFEKLHGIGISGIIIKIERLVHHIPNKIIELCDHHLIPLIQIGKDTKYESIILDVLSPIIDKNVNLLNKYYEVHSELTSLALRMPSMEEILSEFKKMIFRDVSLVNYTLKSEINTNADLLPVTILDKSEVLKERYMHFNYNRYKVIYNSTAAKTVGTQLRVQIPFIGFDHYELIIHELSNEISSEDFMVIENAVKFLQMELLKKYVISQNIFQQKNNIVSDLLNDKLYEKKDIEEVLDSLNINSHKLYQVIIIKLYPQDENNNLDKTLMLPILKQIRDIFRLNFKDIAFLEKSDRIVFILNFDPNQPGFTEDSVERLMGTLIKNNLFKEFFYLISISSKVEKFSIPKANKQVLDTQKILRLFHTSNKILCYEDLGIYKLFVETNNLGKIEKFISPKINSFRINHPELFETLKVFLDTNQSFNLTSEKLFLHPKTVRYRIQKIKEILDIDFKNPEETLQIQIASRLFKLIEGGK